MPIRLTSGSLGDVQKIQKMNPNSFPPTALVLFSIVSIQLGAGLAIKLFPLLGAEGTVAVRIIFSALLLLLLARHKMHSFKKIFLDNTKLLVSFGLSIAAMNLFFYSAIERIPLGAAVAIEFAGPLGVAAFKSKQLIHFVWVTLAAFGIFLLSPVSPLSGLELDSLGIFYALLSGVGWALFIVLAERVGDHTTTNDGLVIGMLIAASVMLPLAIPVTTTLLFEPMILLAALGIALLSTTIPISFEFEALKRMSARSYGILVSVEPAVAALIGAILLKERIGWQGIMAVTCVVVAAIGISITDRQKS